MIDSRPPYYPNLEAEISRNGFLKRDIAKAVGISERHFLEKLTGNTDFWWKEALRIQAFFPNTSLTELFYHPEN